MKVGDILKIKGSLGFLMNPEMIVIEIKGNNDTGMVLLESVETDVGGLLSHLNQSWHGTNFIKGKGI